MLASQAKFGLFEISNALNAGRSMRPSTLGEIFVRPELLTVMLVMSAGTCPKEDRSSFFSAELLSKSKLLKAFNPLSIDKSIDAKLTFTKLNS